jgi:hypothetical protein
MGCGDVCRCKFGCPTCADVSTIRCGNGVAFDCIHLMWTELAGMKHNWAEMNCWVNRERDRVSAKDLHNDTLESS